MEDILVPDLQIRCCASHEHEVAWDLGLLEHGRIVPPTDSLATGSDRR